MLLKINKQGNFGRPTISKKQVTAEDHQQLTKTELKAVTQILKTVKTSYKRGVGGKFFGFFCCDRNYKWSLKSMDC